MPFVLCLTRVCDGKGSILGRFSLFQNPVDLWIPPGRLASSAICCHGAAVDVRLDTQELCASPSHPFLYTSQM